MKKIAVFVEGQTELILTREFLLRKYVWQVNIDCYHLRSHEFIAAEYNYHSPAAKNYYQIVNVGNDSRVLSVVLGLENKLYETGFEKIVCLRDLYSRNYKDFASEIDSEISERMINGTINTIKSRAINPDRIVFNFSIMETEAWILGMSYVLTKLHPELSMENLLEKVGVNFNDIDPEVAFFNPAKVLNDVYCIVGLKYDKHKSDIEALAKVIDIDDYDALYIGKTCNSFNDYYDSLVA